jgi:hypothetical protein
VETGVHGETYRHVKPEYMEKHTDMWKPEYMEKHTDMWKPEYMEKHTDM